MDKTPDYYASLPYTIELRNSPAEEWFARVKELPGCMSQGETASDAAANIQEALRLWLEVSLEQGDVIPEPRSEAEYSGKFVVRVPRSLHRDLAEQAESEGVSLNQYINTALAQAVASTHTSRVQQGPEAVAQQVARLETLVDRLATILWTLEPGASATSAQRTGRYGLALHEGSTAYDAAGSDQTD